jgi:NADPH2:quinone reductase
MPEEALWFFRLRSLFTEQAATVTGIAYLCSGLYLDGKERLIYWNDMLHIGLWGGPIVKWVCAISTALRGLYRHEASAGEAKAALVFSTRKPLRQVNSRILEEGGIHGMTTNMITNMKALTFREFGGPEVLTYADVPVPSISGSQVLVRMEAIGLNYADIYRRKGNYHLAGAPPYIAGYEGAGEVVRAGGQTTRFRVGDRVAFADVPYANAELVKAEEERLIPLPDDIGFDQAASLLLQGLTAHYLTNDSYPVQAGDWMLVHAAAGGVGQILTQLGKQKGANVVGLVSAEPKKQAAYEAGADHVFLYDEDWPAMTRACREDADGADVVYDSVGATLSRSIDTARTKGTIVFYGMAGGDPPPVDPRRLMDASKRLIGGDLWSYLVSYEERSRRAEQLFALLRDGHLRLQAPRLFELKDGAEAHRYLESRKSTGKIVLIP